MPAISTPSHKRRAGTWTPRVTPPAPMIPIFIPVLLLLFLFFSEITRLANRRQACHTNRPMARACGILGRGSTGKKLAVAAWNGARFAVRRQPAEFLRSSDSGHRDGTHPAGVGLYRHAAGLA